MKIIALSDLHIDKKDDSSKIQEIVDNIYAENPDTIVIGGDIATSKEWIHEFLSRFWNLSCNKIAYLWNHEIASIENSTLKDWYIEELDQIFSLNWFHLLDKSPVVIDNIGFIGNCWWFDGTLYKGEEFEKTKIEETARFRQHYKHWWILPEEFCQNIVSKIKNQIDQIKNSCEKIILGIHDIWFEEFLKYGYSEQYDQYNYGMWSKYLWDLYFYDPKIVMWFCWHTHRSWILHIKNKIINNISSNTTNQFYVINI